MEVQIFGIRKNPETRKALRSFAERSVKTHFVDLIESWIEKLSLEPLLLKMSLVRNANQLSIGDDETTWKKWMER
jgi:hypothetical protein